MKTLLLLRHAKSSWADSETADHDRPLNDRGKRDAPRIGQLLNEEGLVPDLIVSSTAKRARDTTKLVVKNCDYADEPRFCGDLYLASPHEYVSFLESLSGDVSSILLVGHNPGLEDLVSELSGQFNPLPTAALVHLVVETDDWSTMPAMPKCRLLNVWKPKELKGR